MDLTVAVIAKECLPGRVKTRLSPPLSPKRCRSPGPAEPEPDPTVRAPPGTETGCWSWTGHRRLRDATKDPPVVPQATGGLDERLAAICDAATGPLLIIGMDTPQFSADHVAPLFTTGPLDDSGLDAWIGPATDGGFWALALRRPDGALIRGVPMSTDTTGARQLARLSARGLSVGTLPELADMDHFSDALQIAAKIPRRAFAEAVTRTAVRVQHPRQEAEALL